MYNTSYTRDRYRKYFFISFEFFTCRIALDYVALTFSFHKTADGLEDNTRACEALLKVVVGMFCTRSKY